MWAGAFQVGKLGFSLNDKKLKRAGLDYWEYVSFEYVPDKVIWCHLLSLPPHKREILLLVYAGIIF